MKLTPDAIRSAKKQPGTTLYDDAVRGLGLKTYGSGLQSFVFRYRTLDGIEHTIKIGRLGEWTLQAARDRCRELRREVDRGGDPAGDRRARREAARMEDLGERFLRDVLPLRRQKNRSLPAMQRRVRYVDDQETRDVGEIVRQLGRHVPVASIHPGDIAELHRKWTEANGPVRANRLLGLCATMFALSLRPVAGEDKPWRDHALGNPCTHIKKNHEEPRERFFSPQELSAIADAIADYAKEHRGDAAADCLRLIALTGCRPIEAQLAAWDQFEESGIWNKPSSHTKTRKSHRLPLSPPAVELVEQLRKRKKPNGTWMFPGQRRGPITTLAHPWKYVRERAGLEVTARIYDLRHSVASHAVGAGLGLFIVGKLLGHSSARSTERYSHLATDVLQDAADRVGSVIGAAMNGNGKSAEVLPHPKARRRS
jgi:integrase